MPGMLAYETGIHRRTRPPTVGKIFSRMSDTHLDAVAGSCEDLGMTDTDTPTTAATGSAIRDAIARRLADMPTEIIIPRSPDRSRNAQRPARRTRRTRTL